jgi:hypothetical protein
MDEECEFECDRRSVEVSVDIGRIACSRHLELFEESRFKASMKLIVFVRRKFR